MIHTFNDASFMKVIQKTCEQMFGENALEEQVEWMKKATFPSDTNPEEAIKRLQEISDNLEFFESGAWKLSEKELTKDVIAKNLQGEIKAELVRNKGHKCVDLDKAIEIIPDCKRYIKNGAKKKRTNKMIKRSQNQATKYLSQTSVEQTTKMSQMILQHKDRPKIQDTKKIQDTNDVVTKNDSGGMANNNTLLMTKKVKWKGLERVNKARIQAK